jgi:hypothetical protein
MINFISLEQGASFYVIGTNGGLNVAVGTVKGKSGPYYPMPANGMSSQLVDLTVTFNGQDRVIQGLPINLEVAGREPEIYTGNRELAERIIDEKMTEAQGHIQNQQLYKKILQDGPKCKEVINPGYAATRKQVETIEQLQQRATSTEKELQELKAQNARMLELLEKAVGGTGKGDKK